MFIYPYGNLHGLNLDWFLNQWKKFQTSFTSAFSASSTVLQPDEQPSVEVDYDQQSGNYDFHFGLPATVKPSGFEIGYQGSASGTVIPTGPWLSSPPAVPAGEYLWSRTRVIYNDNQYSQTYAVSRQGVDGAGSPSTTVPLMDGTGATGSSTAFARADHVHPSDTTKLDSSNLATATPTMDGTGAVGTSTKLAREDHVHPSDTSKLDASDFVLSSTTPQMDGVGASGESTQVARADHVHPSDSTKLGASSLATAIPQMDGTGAVGTSSKIAREDHVHPSDTTKQDVLSTSMDNVTESWTGVGTLYLKFSKFGNVVVATVRINTDSATPAGSFSKANVIPSTYRPNAVFTDGATGMISRENSGTQGTGTFKINSDGSVAYGVNETGVPNVVMMTTIAYLT